MSQADNPHTTIAMALLRKGEPTVDSGLGCHFSLYQGEEECRRLIEREYRKVWCELRRLQRITSVSPKAEKIWHAKRAVAMAAIDRAFADVNAAEAELHAACNADDQAFLAVCAYRCRTPEEAKIKAEYLLTTAMVKDSWDDDARALLESVVA